LNRSRNALLQSSDCGVKCHYRRRGIIAGVFTSDFGDVLANFAATGTGMDKWIHITVGFRTSERSKKNI